MKMRRIRGLPRQKTHGGTAVNRAAASKFLLLKKEATSEAAFQPFIFAWFFLLTDSRT
ncbi:hypothetical protein M2C83_13695 [Cupriavidus basilensis]|nr:hypothetical protein [Cupriavidus basilensis]